MCVCVCVCVHVTLRFSNRCLHSHSSQQPLVALQNYIEICTISVLTGLWVSHYALSFSRTAVVTLRSEKWWTHKTSSVGSFDTNFICNNPFPVVTDKRETEYENKSTTLDRQRKKKKMSWKERKQTQILTLSFTFPVARASAFKSLRRVRDPFRELTPK